MDPELVIAFSDSEDTFGLLYGQFDFCGDRIHSFTDTGSSTVNNSIMQITTSSTGAAEIRINADDDSMLGTWTLTQTTSLTDYSLVASVTIDWIIEIVCPYPNHRLETNISPQDFTHEFY